MNTASTPERSVPIRLVLWYQRLFAGRPSPCRFSPSCSAYALEALETHGTRRGLTLTLRRLARCRPFGPSGWDPVPEAQDRSSTATRTVMSRSATCTSEKGC